MDTQTAEAERVGFTAMEHGSPEDWQVLSRAFKREEGRHVDHIVDHLRLLEHDHGGFAVDRLTHSLQTATRAFRDGRDEEYVVCALLHDIGDFLIPANHPALAVTILKPFVSEANLWMLEMHGIFQGYYFFHHMGMDRDAREKFRDHPHFQRCADFCRLYDQNSFDPAYDTMPLDAFIPMMRRVMSNPRGGVYGME